MARVRVLRPMSVVAGPRGFPSRRSRRDPGPAQSSVIGMGSTSPTTPTSRRCSPRCTAPTPGVTGPRRATPPAPRTSPGSIARTCRRSSGLRRRSRARRRSDQAAELAVDIGGVGEAHELGVSARQLDGARDPVARDPGGGDERHVELLLLRAQLDDVALALDEHSDADRLDHQPALRSPACRRASAPCRSSRRSAGRSTRRESTG